MFHATIIEDDEFQARLLGGVLESHHISTQIISSYADAYTEVTGGLKSNVVLLDYDLGSEKGDGVGLCELISQTLQVPILAITASKEVNVISGFLNAGASRLIEKPVQPSQLIALVKNLLTEIRFDYGRPCGSATEPGLSLDFNRRQVIVNGEPFQMTIKEMELFEELLSREGETISREDIVALIGDGSTNPRYADAMVFKLRQRLASVPGGFQIRSIRNKGYQLIRKV